MVGAGFGLFDYSLNAIWNEVVINLRAKAVMYGLDIFFDAAVGGGKNREFYVEEGDLPSLKDSVLLDTCRKLELISDTTHKKLKHILDMRNDVGISHPTTYSINAYELLGWLQTCVQDVLNDRPTEAALQVQAFISNLKTYTTPLDVAGLQTIKQHISALPSHLCGNILRTVFGIFVAADTDAAVRKNISLLAPAVWSNCVDEPRYKLGIVLEGYRTNLHKDKYELGEQFFETVGGQPFRSQGEKVIILDGLITDLGDKHDGWDNFHHEPPVAAEIAQYVPDQAAVVDAVAERMFRTILICRIGRGLSYNDGVSPRGRPIYDALLSVCGDKFAPMILRAFTTYEVRNRLGNNISRRQAKAALVAARKNVINQRLGESLDYLIANIEKSENAAAHPDFKAIAGSFLI